MVEFPLVINGQELKAHLSFGHVLSPKKSRKTRCSLVIQNQEGLNVAALNVLARCNKKDQFARPVGRFVALGNLVEKVDEQFPGGVIGDIVVQEYNKVVNPYWRFTPETLDRLFAQGIL